ncbi:septum formation initiator family protein [Microaerobacter geothermalis]|uniref:FtsB family cell division protein n=1 Tax=Microaerobacter geothermalis TaxID=674972 RepID=UPI001F203E42|nr:septum formation initiator family protein [Microaerobacter geothermalis]MCF6094689.1 septum formation initiator family protein [Microaerobacter geothermalis]
MSQQMQDMVNKGQKRRLRLMMGILILFMAWAIYTWYDQSLIIKQKQFELTQYQKEREEVYREYKELNQQVNKLNDEEYVAELARKYYFLAKPGEILFIIPSN